MDGDGERERWMVQVARALADATRYRMLQEIRTAGEITCSALHARFPLSQATCSHHVKTLQQAGLVRIRAQGLFRYLSAEPARLAAFASGVVAELGGNGMAPAARAKAAPAKKTAPAARANAAPAKRKAPKAPAKKSPPRPRRKRAR